MDKLIITSLVVPAMAALVALISPYRAYFILIAAIVMSWFGVVTWYSLSTYRWCDRIVNSTRHYALDTSVLGSRTLRVDAPSDLEGMMIRLRTSDGGFPLYEDYQFAKWRFQDASGPLERPERSSDALFNLEDGIGIGDRRWLDVAYEVTPQTKDQLSQLVLHVMPSRVTLELAEITRAVSGYFALGAGAATLVALAALVAQHVRFRRSRTQRAVRP